MRSIDLIGSYVIACLCTVFVGAQQQHLTSNTVLKMLLNRFKRQAPSIGAAMGAAAPGATGSDPFAFAGFQDYLFSVFSNDPQPSNSTSNPLDTLPPDILSPLDAQGMKGEFQQGTPQVIGLTTTTPTTTTPATTTTTQPTTTEDWYPFAMNPYMRSPRRQLPAGVARLLSGPMNPYLNRNYPGNRGVFQPLIPPYMPPRGMHSMWMDPPDGLPYYMMAPYMRAGGMMGQRYHDGIPGRLADGPDAAQQAYRNTAAMRAMNAINGVPPPQPRRSRPRPSGNLPARNMFSPPAQPPPQPRPRTRQAPPQGIYYMSPDLIRAGLPAMLDPYKARLVRPVINRMRAMGNTPDQISDTVGDILMV